MGFLSAVGLAKKKDPADEVDRNAPPKPVQYQSPFPLTGEQVTHGHRVYTAAAKLDNYMFRTIADELNGFTLRYDRNGVYVWDRKIAGESMNLIKVFSVFECKPEVMWDMLHDPVYRIVWDDSRLEGYRVTLLNQTNDIGYYAGKSPAGVHNRDFLNQRAWHNAGNGEYTIFNTSVQHVDCPDQKGFTRAVSKVSGYVIRPHGDGQCSLTYLTQMEPKGWLPTQVVNYVTTKFAPNMMDKLRKASSAYEAWRAEKGAAWECDWQGCPEEPWEMPTENKIIEFVAARENSGSAASPIVPTTPVDEGDFKEADPNEQK